MYKRYVFLCVFDCSDITLNVCSQYSDGSSQYRPLVIVTTSNNLFGK